MKSEQARKMLWAIETTARPPITPVCIDRFSAKHPGSEAAIGELIHRKLLKITPDGKQFRITRAGRSAMLGTKAVA